jgi:exodeoxyribonuclease V beta subunit
VALTRAKDACFLGWGAVNGAQNSALAWLLHAEDGVQSGTVDRSPKLPDWLAQANVQRRLQAYANRAGGAVRVIEPPASLAEGFRAPPGTPPQGGARDDLPEARPDWSVFSFSRLVAGGKHRLADSGADDEVLDLAPAVADPAALPAALPTSPPAAPAPRAPVVPSRVDDAIALRGPAFGTAIHQLLEGLDPASDWPDPNAGPGDTHLAETARYLKNGGLPLGEGAERRALLHAVCRMISRTLHTPLPEIGPLAQVPAQRRLVEMEFYLALGGERIGRILEALNAYGYAITLAPERARATLNGLMQGYIDLTVEADGRYWIIDYKTNDLGADRADYLPDALARAVRYGHYDLQYLIYLVALHRHLTHTLPNYHPGHHLAGAQYLFLRGLDGSSTATGVFVDAPPAELIVTLDALFAGPVEALSRARSKS